MGFGDMLIAAGQAESLYRKVGEPVTICEHGGTPRWSPVWYGNPAVRVPQRGDPAFRAPYVLSGKGHHPYLTYPWSAETGWTFTNWRVRDERPSLYLTEAERDEGVLLSALIGPYIVLEPTSLRKNVNRRPPTEFWQRLVWKIRKLSPWPIVQLAHEHAVPLDGVHQVGNTDFRHACAILSGASAFIGTEGGLPHAAAALMVPAVVLWGGNISCEALGYPEHVNLMDASPQTPCGALTPCPHCADAWSRLQPSVVVDALAVALERQPHGVS